MLHDKKLMLRTHSRTEIFCHEHIFLLPPGVIGQLLLVTNIDFVLRKVTKSRKVVTTGCHDKKLKNTKEKTCHDKKKKKHDDVTKSHERKKKSR